MNRQDCLLTGAIGPRLSQYDENVLNVYEEERNGKEDERKGKKTVGINFMKGGGGMKWVLS